MKAFIATDFTVTVWNGKLYFKNAFVDILKRYKNAFENIVLCTRVSRVDSEPQNMYEITQDIDKVIEVKSLFHAFLNKINFKKDIEECDIVISRVPSIIAYRAAEYAKKIGKPYLTESMGCAWDAYWNHGLTGKLIAPYMFYKMKSLVKNADYAIYVTEKYLQKKYPCKNKTIAASNVKIVVDVEKTERLIDKYKNFDKKQITLMTAAAVDVRYKGQEYVIKAIPILKKAGITVKYNLAGQGDKTYLETLAKKYNVLEQISFLGTLSHDEVMNKMDKSDIYIQPSLQEGLPRAMIEAMSRGCVCLGARTAGIPELISDDCVFERKSVSSIVSTVIKIVNSDINKYSKMNFENSKKYDSKVLDIRRNLFFETIKKEILTQR